MPAALDAGLTNIFLNLLVLDRLHTVITKARSQSRLSARVTTTWLAPPRLNEEAFAALAEACRRVGQSDDAGFQSAMRQGAGHSRRCRGVEAKR